MKKMFKTQTCFVLLIITFMILNSCREVHVYDGKTVIVKKATDASLHDSVLIFGHVYTADKHEYPEINSKIWVDESSVVTYSDTTGFYNIKLKSGVYTINCSRRYSNKNEIEVFKNVALLPNNKIEINFYLGFTDE
jgi:hypothetical protein